MGDYCTLDFWRSVGAAITIRDVPDAVRDESGGLARDSYTSGQPAATGLTQAI
jgi:hypothetical protein